MLNIFAAYFLEFTASPLKKIWYAYKTLSQFRLTKTADSLQKLMVLRGFSAKQVNLVTERLEKKHTHTLPLHPGYSCTVGNSLIFQIQGLLQVSL